MTIKMMNFGLTWTDLEGVHRASAVSYDEVSGERRKQRLEDAGCTDVELVEVRLGQLPQPRALFPGQPCNSAHPGSQGLSTGRHATARLVVRCRSNEFGGVPT